METILNFSSDVANVKAGEGRALMINGVETVFRYCPPGKFMMGSSEWEIGRWEDEQLHQVTLTQGFWMTETQTTRKLWKETMGDVPSSFEADEHPVDAVSWYDCQDFVCKLNSLNVAPLGFSFSLPTEAQWEYACRSGALNPFLWDSLVDANIDSDNMIERYDSLRELLEPIELDMLEYPTNYWNLWNMRFGVGEWCLDIYADYPTSSQIDPCVMEGNAQRVVRGSGWNCSKGYCRWSDRYANDPSLRMKNQGCRLVLIQTNEVDGGTSQTP